MRHFGLGFLARTLNLRAKFMAWVVLVALLAVSGWSSAKGEPIKYIVSATSSGSLGAVEFSNASLTITAFADTSGIFSSFTGIDELINTAAVVFVSGVGSATITDVTQTVANQPYTVAGGVVTSAGIGDVTNNRALLFAVINANSSPLLGYELATSIGPIAGTPGLYAGMPFNTTAGPCVLRSVSDVVTFQDIVPEPSTLMLAAFGFAGLVAWGWRQRVNR